jgi:hypothetical protein
MAGIRLEAGTVRSGSTNHFAMPASRDRRSARRQCVVKKLDVGNLRCCLLLPMIPGGRPTWADMLIKHCVARRKRATEKTRRDALLSLGHRVHEPPDMITRRVNQRAGDGMVFEFLFHFDDAAVYFMAQLICCVNAGADCLWQGLYDTSSQGKRTPVVQLPFHS